MSTTQLPSLPISYTAVDGVDVRVATSDGGHDQTLILTCPWPESLYAFESTWPVLSVAAREDYLSSYMGDRFTESCRYVRSYDIELPVLGDLLPQIQTPVLVLQGDHDPYVPPANGAYLDDRLPHSKLHQFDASHFFWEDAGQEFGSLVSAWMLGGYTDVG